MFACSKCNALGKACRNCSIRIAHALQEQNRALQQFPSENKSDLDLTNFDRALLANHHREVSYWFGKGFRLDEIGFGDALGDH